jgi:hypothetical protein
MMKFDIKEDSPPIHHALTFRIIPINLIFIDIKLLTY